jgi:hypothetical protein
MNNQQILDQCHVLGLVSLTVADDYDQLRRQIRDGLLLAVAGKVERISDDAYRVKGHNVFIIGTPRRWHCNCEQGKTYGPVFGNFLDAAGRICKHIAAVGLVLTSAVDNPPLLPRPASILELVTRIASVPLVAIFEDENSDIKLPTGGTNCVRLVMENKELFLSCGRVDSGTLAEIVEGRARMSPDAAANYAAFSSEMQRRGLAPVTPLVHTQEKMLGLQEATL